MSGSPVWKEIRTESRYKLLSSLDRTREDTILNYARQGSVEGLESCLGTTSITSYVWQKAMAFALHFQRYDAMLFLVNKGVPVEEKMFPQLLAMIPLSIEEEVYKALLKKLYDGLVHTKTKMQSYWIAQAEHDLGLIFLLEQGIDPNVVIQTLRVQPDIPTIALLESLETHGADFDIANVDSTDEYLAPLLNHVAIRRSRLATVQDKKKEWEECTVMFNFLLRRTFKYVFQWIPWQDFPVESEWLPMYVMFCEWTSTFFHENVVRDISLFLLRMIRAQNLMARLEKEVYNNRSPVSMSRYEQVNGYPLVNTVNALFVTYETFYRNFKPPVPSDMTFTEFEKEFAAIAIPLWKRLDAFGTYDGTIWLSEETGTPYEKNVRALYKLPYNKELVLFAVKIADHRTSVYYCNFLCEWMTRKREALEKGVRNTGCLRS